MEITKVHYSALVNLGNYSNEKIGLVATVGDGETPESVVGKLREKVREIAGPNADEMYNKIYEDRSTLRELENKIKKATTEWNAIAEFLRKQGINKDAVDMPMFKNLLPEVKTEESQIIDGELDSEDDEDYHDREEE